MTVPTQAELLNQRMLNEYHDDEELRDLAKPPRERRNAEPWVKPPWDLSCG